MFNKLGPATPSTHLSSASAMGDATPKPKSSNSRQEPNPFEMTIKEKEQQEQFNQLNNINDLNQG